MTTVSYRFRMRRGTAANLATVNEVPLEGELVIETDTLKQKLGDGVTAYNSLPYVPTGGVTSFNTRTGAVTLTSADVTGALTYTPANKAGDTFTGKVLAPQIDVTGGVSAPAWTTAGLVFRVPASTLTDTTSSGTVAAVYASALGAQTLAASSPTTITFAYTLFIEDPVAGTNVTATNRYALGVASLRSTGNIVAAGAITGAGLTITGTGTLCSSTANVTANVASGATASGSTKTTNIGTTGLAGSITNITLGSGAGTVNIYRSQQAPTSKSAAATLTAAEIAVRIIKYTGAADNLTLPTGTALDTGNAAMAVDTALDIAVVNTGSGTATMAGNTGVTIEGAAGVAAGTSGLFRLRKTATATYILYRLS